ncbi:CheB methylesterase domain-containing protein [Thetidibacter halocola]|uniref:protein-glutamate methylesterase n=1 Tax=Thetidibacter halocola TaxID=2827239 RepID=A0A8J7WC96_9RHOB|nr:CheB methylesterase domain-containing protein [Thetidibacter halocola]MBS0124960.1 chemotaxis protein CheB [Thetidibacter halocola]
MARKSIIIAHTELSVRKALARLVDGLPDFHVIGTTADLVQTFAEVEDNLPNAVLISEDLARTEEFEVMHALFAALDVRWLLIRNTALAGASIPRAKARAPAADLFLLPPDIEGSALGAQLRALTRLEPARASSKGSTPRQTEDSGPYDRLILIGASTGGVDAVLTVLRRFPPDCPPTLIVQHTGRGFGESLVRLLDQQCAPTVLLGDDERTLRRGHVIVAAGLSAHMALTADRPLRVEPMPGDPVSGHRPSVDALFRSAVPVGQRIVAALLTGMGRDGAEGLRALRAVGARTFAQDEASSVVYGMPRAAVEMGAVERSLPIAAMGVALLDAARSVGNDKRELRA